MGRPHTALLDQDKIAEAALALIDERGDFTMPELARRLHVQAASLYHHVDGRSGVVELLREHISTSAYESPPAQGHGWEAAMRDLCHNYRAQFAAHPHLVPLLTRQPVRGPKALAAYEKMVVLMEQAGFPLSMVMAALTAIENFLIGAALDLSAPESMWEVTPDLPLPRLQAALAAQPTDRRPADQAYEFGLDLILEGCRRFLEHSGRSPQTIAGPAGA